MRQGAGRIVVQADIDPRHGLILVPFQIGAFFGLDLVLNTGHVMSGVRPGVRDSLVALGHLRHVSDRRYQLNDIRIGGVAMPPLDVRVNTAIGRLGFDAVMGLNFLNQFREVCFDTQTRELTLMC